MSTILPQEPKGEYTPAPAGSHIATCYGVVDLGTQAFVWQGETKINPQIALFFELSNELMENGKPFTIAATMTMSSHKKSKLRGFLESWRGVAFSDSDFGKFDVSQLIGIGCMLNVTQVEKDGKFKSKINGVMRLPKGTTASALINDRIHFTLDDFHQVTYDCLTQYWKETIAKSPEYKQLKGNNASHEEYSQDDVIGHLHSTDAEIPF